MLRSDRSGACWASRSPRNWPRFARSNVDRFRPAEALLAPVDILEADVTTVDLPEDDLLLHLYHPFETSITERVLQRLETSRALVPRRVTIAYLAYTEAIPGSRELLDRFEWLHPVRYEQSVAVSTTGCCTRPEH